MSETLFTRNFTFLILGQVSSLIGNYSLKFALSMYVLEQTGSAAVFAGLLAAAMLPTILLSPLGGILADRANRRTIMVALDLLSGFSVLSAALLFPFGNEITVIGALLIVLSVLGAFESPTVQACVPQMLTERQLLKGNAVVNQVQAVTSLVTPFLGSLFYTAFGIRTVLCGAVLCFFLTALLECFIRLPFEKPSGKQKIASILKDDFRISMRFLCKEQPAVLKLLLLAALVSLFVVGIAVVGFPYLVRTALGLSAEHYGAAESAAGASAIFGSLFLGLFAEKMRFRHLSWLMAAAGLCLLPAGAAFLLPLGVFGTYLVLVSMICLCQFSCSIFSVYALSAIQMRTPEHMTGKIMACVLTISMCAQPAGQLLYGSLFDLFSGRAALVLLPSGLIICGIAAASTRFFHRLEQEGSIQ